MKSVLRSQKFKDIYALSEQRALDHLLVRETNIAETCRSLGIKGDMLGWYRRAEKGIWTRSKARAPLDAVEMNGPPQCCADLWSDMSSQEKDIKGTLYAVLFKHRHIT